MTKQEQQAIEAAALKIKEAADMLDEIICPTHENYKAASVISNYAYRAQLLSEEIENQFPA